MLFPSSALAVGVTALTLLGTSLSIPIHEEAPDLLALPLGHNRRAEENGNIVLPPDFWEKPTKTAVAPPASFTLPAEIYGPHFPARIDSPPAGRDVADHERTTAEKRQIFGCLGILCRSKPRRDLARSAAEATHPHWPSDVDDDAAAVATRDLTHPTLVRRDVASIGSGIRHILCRYLEILCKPNSTKLGAKPQTLKKTPPRSMRPPPEHVEPPLAARAPDSAGAKIWVPKPPDRFLCLLFHICKPGGEDMVQIMKDQARKEQEAQAEEERKEKERKEEGERKKEEEKRKKEEEKRKKEEERKKKEDERPRLSKPPSRRRGVQDPRSLPRIPTDPSTGDMLGVPHSKPQGGFPSHPPPYNTIPQPDDFLDPVQHPNTKRDDARFPFPFEDDTVPSSPSLLPPEHSNGKRDNSIPPNLMDLLERPDAKRESARFPFPFEDDTVPSPSLLPPVQV